MRVIIEKKGDTVAVRAANFVTELLHTKPDAVLGLATGSTPLGLYTELIRRHREEGLDFSKVTTFNLDEYYGLLPNHPQSYHHFMRMNLFDHINIPESQINIPSGTARDIEAWCDSYERRIKEAGGIDLQVLGIGNDGHIAFNEPGSSLGSRTRLKTLTEETIKDNARFFGTDEDVPMYAITVGVGTIMEARSCLILATGESKAHIWAEFIEGPVTAQVTATALQLHPRVTAICDEQAASLLERRDYYAHIERMSAKLQHYYHI
jgi:glucosamine-6-phosphate deaminase